MVLHCQFLQLPLLQVVEMSTCILMAWAWMNLRNLGWMVNFPSNVQVRTHFPSVVNKGYESDKEAIEIKFPPSLRGKELPLFSAGYIDGHTKAVMIHAVFAILDSLDPWFWFWYFFSQPLQTQILSQHRVGCRLVMLTEHILHPCPCVLRRFCHRTSLVIHQCWTWLHLCGTSGWTMSTSTLKSSACMRPWATTSTWIIIV